MSAPASAARPALAAGVLAYVTWGLVPLVFQAMGRAGPAPWEILSHRVLWGALAVAVGVILTRQSGQLARALRTPRLMGLLAISAVLIGINWILFIWAVNTGHTLDTSLGYYMTPLINMAAGALLFRERIDRISRAAMLLAALGVAVQALAIGHAPWVALALAVSFGGYGALRKHIEVDAQPGFLIECLVLLAPCAAYVAWLQAHGQGHFGASTAATLWLIASGPITAAPLVLFAWAARRLPLSMMGFLQFLAPTLSFAVGLAEGESFTPLRAVSFVFIWAGAGVYAWGLWTRAAGRPASADPPAMPAA